jgi:hypothetical protein
MLLAVGAIHARLIWALTRCYAQFCTTVLLMELLCPWRTIIWEMF